MVIWKPTQVGSTASFGSYLGIAKISFDTHHPSLLCEMGSLEHIFQALFYHFLYKAKSHLNLLVHKAPPPPNGQCKNAGVIFQKGAFLTERVSDAAVSYRIVRGLVD